MLHTVEAEIDRDGVVRWLESLPVSEPSHVLITFLEDRNGMVAPQGNAAQLLEVLQSPAFMNRRSYAAEAIEAQLEENRQTWE
jgi:hypothetical protein